MKRLNLRWSLALALASLACSAERDETLVTGSVEQALAADHVCAETPDAKACRDLAGELVFRVEVVDEHANGESPSELGRPLMTLPAEVEQTLRDLVAEVGTRQLVHEMRAARPTTFIDFADALTSGDLTRAEEATARLLDVVMQFSLTPRARANVDAIDRASGSGAPSVERRLQSEGGWSYAASERVAGALPEAYADLWERVIAERDR